MRVFLTDLQNVWKFLAKNSRFILISLEKKHYFYIYFYFFKSRNYFYRSRIENLFFFFVLIVYSYKIQIITLKLCSLFNVYLLSCCKLPFISRHIFLHISLCARAPLPDVLIQQVYNEVRSKNPHSRNRSRVPALMFHKWSRNYSSYASSRRRAIKLFASPVALS